ncbi:MAG: hypothetical protein KF787_09180 [Phycisphaeraceae bacterium]|nr:hypothetical protein [Phycisphaerae bacterium]MBX3392806.1 hypothetical protein [Phycisphaeraceae bacterium]HRJ49102.1 hypothetical protein [Phycisphaerales bacterium]
MAHRANRLLVTAALAIAAAAGMASASITGALVHIKATSSLGTAELEFITNSDFENGILTDGLTDSVELVNDNGDLIAILTNLNVLLIADPVVNMNFSVFAGAADTSFVITSTLLGFPALTNPIARSSASVSVTDSNGDGATASGDYGGGKMFRSFYNGAVAGAGSIFATLVDSPVVILDGFGSDDSTEASGPGFDVIFDSVTSMSTEFQFTLSARDQVGATSTFVVVPSPASMALASIGVLAMYRRKR